jgi:hypothetical protein
MQNAQILADEYAQAGFYVYIPDFLEGSAIAALSNVRGSGSSKYVAENGPDQGTSR